MKYLEDNHYIDRVLSGLRTSDELGYRYILWRNPGGLRSFTDREVVAELGHRRNAGCNRKPSRGA